MGALTVTFHGLCFFTGRGTNEGDMNCHPEFGDHIPTLTARVKDVRLQETEWQPAHVGHDTLGEEIAIWDLRGERLTLGRQGVAQSFVQGAEAVDFKGLHPGARPLPQLQIEDILFPQSKPHGARVTLRGGSLTYLASPTIFISIKQRRGQTAPKHHSSALHWSGEIDQTSLPVNKDNQTLALKIDALPEAPVSVHITNVSRDVFPDGLEHWEHYYKLVQGVEIMDRAELLDGRLDTDVYDCVPPAHLIP